MCWCLSCCCDCSFEFEYEVEDAIRYYGEVVQKKSIDNAKQLHPPLTEDEKENLMKIMSRLPPQAQDVVRSNCVDSGAGTGISLVQMHQ
jgi:MinD superfamily P-loop ATPase